MKTSQWTSRVLLVESVWLALAVGCNSPSVTPASREAAPSAGQCPMCRAMAGPCHAFPPAAQTASQPTIPLIGQPAPSFEANTTQGKIRFPDDFKGKWIVLFSHPGDFTPVCTTEFMTLTAMQPDFEAINCQLIGLSVDSNTSHIAWLRTITEKIEWKGMKNVVVSFPVIADIKMDVARQCGMIQPAASDTQTVRAVFIIDPNAIVRALLYYPMSTGRNINEIKRLVIALQTCDAHKVATPANWQPGDDVIIPAPGSCGAAATRMAENGKGYYCLDWFLCFKKMPKDQLTLPPGDK
jgi:peroxiredoxin (alkyl hydroperoxide reductase subunit C)